MSNLVAIVGRPNVGKSTLFNRLVGHRDAIVHDLSGVTRDRHYGSAEWIGRDFVIIDTGGYVVGSQDFFETAIRKQVEQAISEADVLVFMVDTQTGVTDEDERFAQFVRRLKKPIVLVANKVDTFDKINETAEFYRLGLGEVFSLSAANGTGTGEILDKIVELLGPPPAPKEDTGLPRFCIIGRPNVGKSTLTNALLGFERNIVSPIPGTTRDSVDAEYNRFGKHFTLVDTAGLRKKGSDMDDVEFYSVMRAIKALEECDVCLLVIDALQGMQAQDVNIFRLAESRGKGVVILVNKWDAVEAKLTNTHVTYTEELHQKIAPFVDVPVVYISATEKTRIFKAIEVALEVYEHRTTRISTSALNDMLLPIIERFPPPAIKGKYVKIKYITQLPVIPPTFAFFCNLPQYIKESYRRFLENKLRDAFNLSGTPIRIFFRQK